ncbi:MAG: hypothetical protein JNM29_15560 [Candidatus Odyssella sp.]|nr:hypothetical protein [Candidatus Odyssella sp.]
MLVVLVPAAAAAETPPAGRSSTLAITVTVPPRPVAWLPATTVCLAARNDPLACGITPASAIETRILAPEDRSGASIVVIAPK